MVALRVPVGAPYHPMDPDAILAASRSPGAGPWTRKGTHAGLREARPVLPRQGIRRGPAGGHAEDLLLYDSKDLTTHAVCVGMTGSGKTGLGIALAGRGGDRRHPGDRDRPQGGPGQPAADLPRAAARGLPAVGRSGRGGAARGSRREEFAAKTAETWREGLAAWGEDGARIARFRDAVDLAIYTPGSSAGLPLTVLRSFDAPPPGLADQAEAYRERIASAVSGLLALLGIDVDPMSSREHILLSNVLDHAWRAGHDLDMAGADPRRAVAAVPEGRRARPGDVLPGQGPLRPGDEAEQPAGLARVRRLAGGRAAGRRRPALHPRGQAAAVDHLDRASLRQRADVLRHDPAERGAGLGPVAAGHLEPARHPLHGRDLRLLPRHGQPAVEAADADPAQAGARLRPGGRAGDPEPGRPRLQGAVQRGDVVPRPLADPARQGSRARGTGGGLDGRRATPSTGRRWTRSSRRWASASS